MYIYVTILIYIYIISLNHAIPLPLLILPPLRALQMKGRPCENRSCSSAASSTCRLAASASWANRIQ